MSGNQERGGGLWKSWLAPTVGVLSLACWQYAPDQALAQATYPPAGTPTYNVGAPVPGTPTPMLNVLPPSSGPVADGTVVPGAGPGIPATNTGFGIVFPPHHYQGAISQASPGGPQGAPLTGGEYPQTGAALYPSPQPNIPYWTGGSVISSPAFAPHEMLYPHTYRALYPPYYHRVKGAWLWTPFGMRSHERWELQGTMVQVKYRSQQPHWPGPAYFPTAISKRGGLWY